MNLSRSQSRSLVSLGSAGFGIYSAYRDLRKARSKEDRLALLGAVLNFAAVVVSLAIAARALRSGEE